jgi:hypothetical protein
MGAREGGEENLTERARKRYLSSKERKKIGEGCTREMCSNGHGKEKKWTQNRASSSATRACSNLAPDCATCRECLKKPNQQERFQQEGLEGTAAGGGGERGKGGKPLVCISLQNEKEAVKNACSELSPPGGECPFPFPSKDCLEWERVCNFLPFVYAPSKTLLGYCRVTG